MMSDFGCGSPGVPVSECLSLLSARASMPPGAERDVADGLGVHLNQWGLLDSYADASAVVEWMLALPVGESPEPVYWTAAAIAEDRG